VPTATNTPVPTATNTPVPTATSTAVPTPTPLPPSGAAPIYAWNVNGPLYAIDGITFAAGSALSRTGSGGYYCNTSVALIPPADVNREQMIRCSANDSVLTTPSIPNGQYWLYAYIWRSNPIPPGAWSLNVEGTQVAAGSGIQPGEWHRVGPYQFTLSDGFVSVAINGYAALSGFELWQQLPPTATPQSTVTPTDVVQNTSTPTAPVPPTATPGTLPTCPVGFVFNRFYSVSPGTSYDGNFFGGLGNDGQYIYLRVLENPSGFQVVINTDPGDPPIVVGTSVGANYTSTLYGWSSNWWVGVSGQQGEGTTPARVVRCVSPEWLPTAEPTGQVLVTLTPVPSPTPDYIAQLSVETQQQMLSWQVLVGMSVLGMLALLYWRR
jgi:hypothetical protein